MASHDLRLYVAASASWLTLLAFVVAGTSSGSSALLLAMFGLVPSIIAPLLLGAPAIAPAGIGRRS